MLVTAQTAQFRFESWTPAILGKHVLPVPKEPKYELTSKLLKRGYIGGLYRGGVL